MFVYDIQSECLRVDVGNVHFLTRAVSGGRRGSTVLIGGDEKLRNWSFKTKTNEAQGLYGPIPPGFYICHYEAHNSDLGGEVVRLDQTPNSAAAGIVLTPLGLRYRDGFFIHRRWKKGSHGCIVVDDESDRHRINRAVRDHDGVFLHVINPYLPEDLSPRDGTATA